MIINERNEKHKFVCKGVGRMVKNLWDENEAQKCESELEELVYRSNLLGRDRAVCNWGRREYIDESDGKGFSRP